MIKIIDEDLVAIEYSRLCCMKVIDNSNDDDIMASAIVILRSLAPYCADDVIDDPIIVYRRLGRTGISCLLNLLQDIQYSDDTVVSRVTALAWHTLRGSYTEDIESACTIVMRAIGRKGFKTAMEVYDVAAERDNDMLSSIGCWWFVIK